MHPDAQKRKADSGKAEKLRWTTHSFSLSRFPPFRKFEFIRAHPLLFFSLKV
jgi:hypothetical protein